MYDTEYGQFLFCYFTINNIENTFVSIASYQKMYKHWKLSHESKIED